MYDRAGDYEAALQYRSQILNRAAPAYAIKAIAHAAKASGRAREAQTAYQLLIAKSPDDMEAHAGLVYAWMAQDQVQTALDYARTRLPQVPAQYRRSDLPMIVALAELHENRQDWLAAADAFQHVLRFEPGFRYAVRGRVFALGNAGMPFLANRLAQHQPQVFSEDERFRLSHAAAAHLIRFGQAQAAADDGQARHVGTDVALSANASLTRNFNEKPIAQFDRLVALRNRSRMQETVNLFETLRKQQATLPVYAKLAAADAYLALQQPQAARELYLESLLEANAIGSGNMLDAQISLVYAYNEAEQHGAAEALADELLRNTQNKIYPGIRGLEAPNPEYSQVYLARSLLYLYNDRLQEAEARLAKLRMLAPFNPEIRAGWASLQSAREHPRAALEEFTLLLVDRPKSLDAAVGQAETHLSLNELGKAKAALPSLLAAHPDSRALQNLVRRIDNYDSPTYQVAATAGRGAAVLGAESMYAAALYSAPMTSSLGQHFRVFGRVVRANGTDQADRETRIRKGIGFDYRQRDFTAEAEVTQTNVPRAASGMALTLSRDLSDSWRTGLAIDTNVIDLPAAAMRDGIKAKSLKLDMTWRLNESRQAGGELQRLDFSDNNTRTATSLWWKERWISGPKARLESSLGISVSENSLEGRDYFSPERDAALSFSLTGEWLTWRSYQRWFKQRAVVGVGQYWQTGQRRGTTTDVRYEHVWSRDDALELQYGIGRSVHPYYGIRERRHYFFVSLSGRFN